jgi:hypothetical protein
MKVERKIKKKFGSAERAGKFVKYMLKRKGKTAWEVTQPTAVQLLVLSS